MRTENRPLEGWKRAEGLRGAIGGWFPTVPRAELQALIEHARHSPQAIYGGDCKHVVEAAQHGVPRHWVTSRNVNADMWRDLRRLMTDEGTSITAVKIAAHKSRASAADEGGRALELWHGNDEADAYAKELCKENAGKDTRAQKIEAAREFAGNILARIATATAWNLKNKTDLLDGKIKRKVGCSAAQSTEGNHEIVARRRGGWECKLCLKCGLSNIGLRKLRQSPCAGDVEEQIHDTHSMRETRGVRWCINCGCYSTRWPRELRRACRQVPQSEAQRNVRRRLSAGLPPTTAAYLEEVAAERNEEDTIKNGGAAQATRSRQANRTASAPCGRYLRLPGGPLHREAAFARRHDEGDEGVHHDAADHHQHQGSEKNVLPRTHGGPGQRTRHSPQQRQAEEEESCHRADGQAALPMRRVPIDADAGSQVDSRSGGAATASAGGRGPRRGLRGTQSAGPSIMAELHVEEALDLCKPSPADSWSRRLSCRPYGGSAQCQRCDALTRTRCKGCERPICASCAKSRMACS